MALIDGQIFYDAILIDEGIENNEARQLCEERTAQMTTAYIQELNPLQRLNDLFRSQVS